MKRMIALLLALFLLPVLAAKAEDNKPDGREKGNNKPNSGKSEARAPQNTQAHQARQPVVINMSHGSSGGHNRNFPSQQPSQPAAQAPAYRQPSYGKLNWTAPAQSRPQVQQQIPSGRREGQVAPRVYQRPNVQAYSSPGVNAAVAVHHHAYTPGYVRGKLRKLGVTSEPSLITDRAEFIHTDRMHSAIGIPREGPDRGILHAQVISPRHFNDAVVRQQMATVNSRAWVARINQFNSSENRANHYYWHKDQGFDYCHYIDPSGYHWWGWYRGDRFFWTRHYGSRWWWYDTDYDRWCFWNNGFWWWQDPYHVGDLYCYNNDIYISANSANDQVVVTAPNNPSQQAYNSPDGTRVVKVIGESQDAFLYDTANPPTFDPVYLASGAQSVQFSDTNSGRPLEIILKLNDGSFDMFDSYGNAYNPGASDSDQADQGGGDGNQPPPDSGTPPSDGNAPVNN